MRLSDLVQDVIEAHDQPGVGLNMHDAIKDLCLRADDDAELRLTLMWEGARRRIKSAAGAARRQSETADETDPTLDLFGPLHSRYAVDEKGAVMKNPGDMRRFEFRKAIEIRRKSVQADMVHLNALIRIDNALTPFWENDPELTVQQAIALYRAAHVAAE